MGVATLSVALTVSVLKGLVKVVHHTNTITAKMDIVEPNAILRLSLRDFARNLSKNSIMALGVSQSFQEYYLTLFPVEIFFLEGQFVDRLCIFGTSFFEEKF